MKLLKTAIFGLGNIAWQYDKVETHPEGSRTHLNAYSKNPNTRLTSAFEPNKSIAEEFLSIYPDIKIYDSPEELLKKEKPDILSICSPNEFHFQQAEMAIRNTIPMIWLEKPPVQKSLSELDKLIELEEASSTTCLVNFTRRFSPLYEKLKSINIENLEQIRINYSRGMETNGIHIIDILTYICQDFKKFELKGSDFEENPSAIFKFGKTNIQIASSNVPFHCLDIELLTSESRLTALYNGLELREELKVENPDFPGFSLLHQKNPNKKYKSPGLLMDEVLHHLIKSHQEGTPPKSSLKSARSTYRLLEKMRSC